MSGFKLVVKSFKMSESHVVVVEYPTETEARAALSKYMTALGVSYPVERRHVPEVTDDAIGRALAVEHGFGAYVYESPGHEIRKDRKRGFATKWFYAVHGPGPAQKLP